MDNCHASFNDTGPGGVQDLSFQEMVGIQVRVRVFPDEGFSNRGFHQ